MKSKCITKKTQYATQQSAEDVLIDLWIRNDYNEGHAPIAIYKCDECGDFHFTSHGPMNERLAKAITSNRMKIEKEASRWADKWKGKF